MKITEQNPHIGSSVDDFFAEEELLDEIEATAIERVLAVAIQYAKT